MTAASGRRGVALSLGALVAGALLAGCQLAPSQAETTATVSPSAGSATAPSSAAGGANGSVAPAPESTRSTPPAEASAAAAGVRIDPGTYILWKKDRNLVVLVRDGKAVRTMPTTDLDTKTPVGDYTVRFKNKRATAVDGGVFYYLNWFVEYGPVPGHTNIGFHEVPVTPKGRYIQPLSSVGTEGPYDSHGCERMRPADAEAVFAFASVGTKVHVR